MIAVGHELSHRVRSAAAHPDVRSLTQLTREYIEGFLAHNHKRPWRGRVARDQPVSAVVSKRTVIDLRCFLDDLALWGWAERPPRRLLFPADVPRLDGPLPGALPPDADRDLMAAISELSDQFARTGLTCSAAPASGSASCSTSSWTASGIRPATAAG